MKGIYILSLLLALGVIPLKAQQMIDNPSYQFRNSGLYRIEKIERSDKATKIYLLSEFIPGWWVQFSQKEITLEDNFGNRYKPLALEGAAWEEQKPTPASGTDHFIFTFPPLAKDVQTVNWLEGNHGVYGISLSATPASEAGHIPSSLVGNWLTTDNTNRWAYGFYPDFVITDNQFWDYEKVEKKGKKLLLHLKSGERQQQLLLTLEKDGNYKIGTTSKDQKLYQRENFDMEQALSNAPEKSFFQPDSKAYVQGYIHGYDPRAGFTSGLIYNKNIVTAEDFPTVVKLEKDGRFFAELDVDHPISNDILFSRMRLPFYVEPGDTLTLFIDWEDWLQADRYRDRNFKNFQSLRFMGPSSKINADMMKAEINIEGETNARFWDLVKQVTPTAFKIQSLQKQEEKLNILERLSQQYHFTPKSKHLIETNIKTDIGASILDFVSTREYYKEEDPQNQILQAAVPQDYYDFLQQMPLNDRNLLVPYDNWVFFNRFEFAAPFMEAYKISNTYADESYPLLINSYWKAKDSICSDYFHLQPNWCYEIIKIRDLASELRNISRTTADSVATVILAGVKDPYLHLKAHYLLEKRCPREVKASHPLPQGEGADIFRKIIAPYQGKVIFVDFWATTCGPCRAGIEGMKETREAFRGKDVVFLFITDEKSSPLKDYNEFTANLEGEKYRIPADDYNYLRELFQFNGIPHYEIINKEGEVVNGNYYQESLEKILGILAE